MSFRLNYLSLRLKDPVMQGYSKVLDGSLSAIFKPEALSASERKGKGWEAQTRSDSYSGSDSLIFKLSSRGKYGIKHSAITSQDPSLLKLGRGCCRRL